jgi:branched-chain amino acid transport system ATP-binding protein
VTFFAVNDLCVNYGKLEVLKSLSLEVAEGQISVLLGANGSGKSTLFRAIAGLLPPVSGTILFRDRRIERLPTLEILRTGITLMVEGKRLFREMTVEENLEMGAYSRRDRKGVAADIQGMYERFPVLGIKRRKKAMEMSGGEQQMLAIARALMSRPKLLLMDEPAQGLSPILVKEVADIVTSINRDGVTIILVEHNLRLGLSLAQQVYVLENGRIAFQARGGDLSAVEAAKRIYLGG